eukprot:scaffold301041_cov35-Attheya_sp.AAC.1
MKPWRTNHNRSHPHDIDANNDVNRQTIHGASTASNNIDYSTPSSKVNTTKETHTVVTHEFFNPYLRTNNTKRQKTSVSTIDNIVSPLMKNITPTKITFNDDSRIISESKNSSDKFGTINSSPSTSALMCSVKIFGASPFGIVCLECNKTIQHMWHHAKKKHKNQFREGFNWKELESRLRGQITILQTGNYDHYI